MSLRHYPRILGPGHKGTHNLSVEDADRAFSAILSGQESEIQVGAFLVLVRTKGLTVEELTGFARAARRMATIPCQGMDNVVALCPPHDGVDHLPPLDVAAGLVAAGAGARVLLLSDRCVPPKRGLTAASVLDGLGVGMTWDAGEVESWVEKTGFGAVAVTGLLPPLLSLRKVRNDVVIRTPLSTVEKLLAPSSAAVVVGTHQGAVLGTAIEVMSSLGHPRGIALQGPEGGIVPSVTRRTRGIEISERHVVPLNIEPQDFGMLSSEEPDLPTFGPPPEGKGTGDDPQLVEACGRATLAVLSGVPSSARDATLLSAALALKAAGRAHTIAEGVDLAARSLDSGAASAVLERLRALS